MYSVWGGRAVRPGSVNVMTKWGGGRPMGVRGWPAAHTSAGRCLSMTGPFLWAGVLCAFDH